MSTHPLDDSWSKVERAKTHVDAIRRRLPEPGEEGVYPIPFRREYNADMGAIQWLAKSLPKLPDDLSLIVGDALHNFRSGLDLAWWQLALKHLGKPPSPEQATSVQFPIRRPGKEFNVSTHATWVGKTAADIAESVQPPKAWDQTVPPVGNPPVPPPLGALRHLSNTDKHQVLNVTFYGIFGLDLRSINRDELRDCTVDTTRTADGSGLMQLPPPDLRPEADSEILRFYVIATGNHPDVNFDPGPTTAVVVEPHWQLLPTMNVIGAEVAAVLRRFEPLL